MGRATPRAALRPVSARRGRCAGPAPPLAAGRRWPPHCSHAPSWSPPRWLAGSASAPGDAPTVGRCRRSSEGPGSARGPRWPRTRCRWPPRRSGGLEIGDGTAMVVRTLAPSGTETTVACSGNIATSGYGGDGGPATDASCDGPYGLVVDRAGDLFLADNQNNRIRVVAATSGTRFGPPVTAGSDRHRGRRRHMGLHRRRRAGAGAPNWPIRPASPWTAPATSSSATRATPSSGWWRPPPAPSTGSPMTAGDIYTVAGDGTAGIAGQRRPRRSGAELDQPDGLAVDSHGNLVIADLGNNQVRVVAAADGTFYGRPMTAGDIYTVAGDGTAGFAGDGGPAAGAELDMPGRRRRRRPGRPGRRRLREQPGAAGGCAVGHRLRAAGEGRGHLHAWPERARRSSAGDGGPAGTRLPRPPRGRGGRGRTATSSWPTRATTGSGSIAAAHRGRLRPVAWRPGTIRHGGRHRRLGGYSGDGGPAAGAVFNLPTGVARERGPATWPWPTRTTTGSGSSRPVRDVLRSDHGRRRHLHGGRRRDRRDRAARDGPGRTRGDRRPLGGGVRRGGQPAHRRVRRQPGPGGGRHDAARSTDGR